MRKILIHINIVEYGEYDIFHSTNYEALYNVICSKRKGDCPNFGNRLWFQGLISEIQSRENIIDYYDYSMTKEYINENYDLIIAPMANIFSVNYSELLESLAEKFTDIKIPVYVIACGIQAKSYTDLGMLCKVLHGPATRFIDTIYKTGGEFALRGYFTKEFFDRLGFSSAVVTGCPSLYQIGKNIKIQKGKKDIKLKPLINGNLMDYNKVVDVYSDVEFFDQHQFYHELYDTKFASQGCDFSTLKQFVKKYGLEELKWLCENKIKLIPDMNDWRAYLIYKEFNFSFGKRIHGTIMPILAGIPAVLDVCDSRTREMAEFFDIPYLLPGEYKKYNSLDEIYEWMDYDKFNKTFAKKYDAFELFLRKCGIVENINQNNMFFSDNVDINIHSVNDLYWEKMRELLNEKKLMIFLYDKLIKLKRSLIQR